MDVNRTFCSRRAQMAGVSISGTATEATTWLLIEVPAPWGGKALAESDLPADVTSHLLAWENEANNRRVQFIRRETNTFDAPGRITVFVASVSSRSPALSRSTACYALHLDAYSDLLDVDLEQPLDESARPAHATAHPDPIFLTCTNGRRDACCAKWGRAMAHAMAEEAGRHAWQTTHLGGHRFAPTLLVLPHGSQYGWLAPDVAGPLVDAHRDGRLYRLDRYRGHVGFKRPVQAAAAFLRDALDSDALDSHALNALTVVDVTRNDDTLQVRFRVAGQTYAVPIRHTEGPTMPVSCGAAPKPTERLTPLGCRVV